MLMRGHRLGHAGSNASSRLLQLQRHLGRSQPAADLSSAAAAAAVADGGAGQVVLVTGATGKVGTVFLAEYARTHPAGIIRALCNNRTVPESDKLQVVKGSIGARVHSGYRLPAARWFRLWSLLGPGVRRLLYAHWWLRASAAPAAAALAQLPLTVIARVCCCQATARCAKRPWMGWYVRRRTSLTQSPTSAATAQHARNRAILDEVPQALRSLIAACIPHVTAHARVHAWVHVCV